MSNTANDPANMSEETFRHYEQMAYSQIEDRVKQLESENAQLRRQVEFCKRKRPASLNTGFVVLDRCQLCDGWLGKHDPDCPHNQAKEKQ